MPALLGSREEFCLGALRALLADAIASLLFLPSSPAETVQFRALAAAPKDRISLRRDRMISL